MKRDLEATAEVLSIATKLPLPSHNNYIGEANGKPCEGAGKKPGEVFKDVHTEVGAITAFCVSNCSTIFALVPDGKTFKWEDKRVYGYAPDGRPLGP